ncbi:unnamed protein product [Brachionus calyciflorus]|uniref:Uncharacterized protein n=1 Tax=Brachionus calyciflorus TaxID=104777 RepID=A0A814R7L0_9BILA|nr:unnamed protein product [Brachionus calyciflorus]
MEDYDDETTEIRFTWFVTQYFKLSTEISEALRRRSGHEVLKSLVRRMEDLFHYGNTLLKIDIMMFMGFDNVYNHILLENTCNELEEDEFTIINYQKYLEKVKQLNEYE